MEGNQDNNHDADQGCNACLDSHEHRHDEPLQDEVNKAFKRKLLSPAEDTEASTVVKKRRYSADDAASFFRRESPWEERKCRETKFVTIPQRTRKRRASPVMVSESWQQPGNKKKRLSDDNDASRDNQASFLLGAGPTAEGQRLDGHRIPARKRSCPLPSGSTECFQNTKRFKQTSDSSQQSKSLRGTAEGYQWDEHLIPSRKRSCSLSSGCVECFQKNKRLKQTSFGWPDTRQSLIKAKRRKVTAKLRNMGVRVFERSEVRVMTDAQFDVLGKGAYGACAKTVDPDTQQELVIKSFFNENLDGMLKETMNLFQLQVEGVQRLVGVCVDDIEIISHFAGMTAYQYFRDPVPLADAATVFLKVSQALKRMVNRGFNHFDLHEGNVCVLPGSSGPVATLIDLGLATYLGAGASEANELSDLAKMMDRLLRPDKECRQHPLVADLITWMESASQRKSATEHSLAALEHVLHAILEHVSKATPSGSLVPCEDLVLKRRQDNDVCSVMFWTTHESGRHSEAPRRQNIRQNQHSSHRCVRYTEHYMCST